MDHVAAEQCDLAGAEGLAAGGLDLEFVGLETRRQNVLSSRPPYMPITADIRWSWGNVTCFRRPDHVEDRKVGTSIQHPDRSLIRFADPAEERGGVVDGAGNDLFQRLRGPLGERRAQIGNELVQLEHGRYPMRSIDALGQGRRSTVTTAPSREAALAAQPPQRPRIVQLTPARNRCAR
jgi:hypothetical protein